MSSDAVSHLFIARLHTMCHRCHTDDTSREGNTMPRRRTAQLALAGLAAGVLVAGGSAGTAGATAPAPAPGKVPLDIGTGGAVATVDADATQVGLQVLEQGGNAADAAVAAAAALGVTEPYSAGVGGGGFFGSGLSGGTPGTPLTWARALEEFGTMSLPEVLQGGIRLADEGFVVDETFRQQTAQNEEKFRRFAPTVELFLPGGELPEVGSVFRNPDLARTYELLAKDVSTFYTGEVAADIVRTAQDPPEADGVDEVRAGLLRDVDLAIYDAPLREPTRVDYRGLEVYGMAPPSSGGSTVGQALNMLEQFRLSSLAAVPALHHYLEASALAFADRNAYVGDPAYSQVPLARLLSEAYAAERACAIDPTRALEKPTTAGTPDGEYGPCPAPPAPTTAESAEGLSTTHLTVGDAAGNIASYTLTIEATGGSGITVPDRGFLLNNELTDFTFKAGDVTAPEPNLPAPGKRPRSSMAPTIVLNDGRPLMALGSPGGSTIITTVLQTLVNRIDRNQNLADAIAAPRATQRNTASVNAEPAFLDAYGAELTALGHTFTPLAEIGAATGIEYLPGGLVLAAAEPERRGGGSAAVVRSVLSRAPASSLELAPDLGDDAPDPVEP
jgi:gamma-glutamyltranspeptidase / glutathione hydrolase